MRYLLSMKRCGLCGLAAQDILLDATQVSLTARAVCSTLLIGLPRPWLCFYKPIPRTAQSL
jgi:hypothetical protein